MQQALADTADKHTVLLIKQEHGLDVREELRTYEKEPKEDYAELYNINHTIWDIEALISIETDLAKIGAYCLALRWMNMKRIESKNELAKKAGECIERKKY